MFAFARGELGQAVRESSGERRRNSSGSGVSLSLLSGDTNVLISSWDPLVHQAGNSSMTAMGKYLGKL